MLQPDMEPQRRAAWRPLGRRAIIGAVELDDQAFKAAPGIAHPEQFYGIEQRIDGLLRYRFQHDAEQPGCAGKIAFPYRVPRIALKARVQYPADFRPLLQP